MTTPEREPLLPESRIAELVRMTTEEGPDAAIRQACRETAEACAKVCEEVPYNDMDDLPDKYDAAAAIRAKVGRE